MAQRQQAQWSADEALPGFEAVTLRFPDDYEGKVTATLVRRQAPTPTRRAFLYVHGYMDYFFQAHLADRCNAQGFNFYALDLRKYGRSLGQAPHPNFCKDIREYFAEISAALRIVSEDEGNEWIILNGHSTGGLIAALYADAGAQKARINALFLNSPFFAFNLDPQQTRAMRIAAVMAPLFPFRFVQNDAPSPYVESIHAAYHGEWTFDLRWKPLIGSRTYFGWLRAVLRAHRRVRQGLAITCPVLVMHSDKSIYGAQWNPDFQTGDAVLNVAHIREGSRHLGANVNVVEIRDGLHDLMLSRADVREQVFTELFGWVARLDPAPVPAR